MLLLLFMNELNEWYEWAAKKPKNTILIFFANFVETLWTAKTLNKNKNKMMCRSLKHSKW